MRLFYVPSHRPSNLLICLPYTYSLLTLDSSCAPRDNPSIPLDYFYPIQPAMSRASYLTSLWNAGNIYLDKVSGRVEVSQVQLM